MGDESAQPDPFVGDWDWDPSEDPEWDDPSIPRVRVDPLEIPELASAIVRGASLSYAFIPDLRALVDTIQAHPNAQLAKASEPDANGFIHTDDASPETPSGLTLRGCVVDACEFSDLDIGVTLSINARFAAVARFDRARFAADAWFDRARFDADAWFDEARFAAVAWFGGARFAAEARFDRARFAAEARFDRARFAAVAWFDRARFAAVAWFGDARFAAVAWFGDARFAAVARFDRARFAAVARFDEARFDADAWFGGARFAAVARFDDAIVEGDASFTNARVALLGRLGLHSVRFRRSVSFDNMTIRGHLYLTRSTLDERLTFDGVTFGSRARLGLHRFLPRGGATIELRREHVPGIDDQRRTALHPPTKHKTSLAGRGPARQPAYWCWFIWWWVRYWLGLRRHLPVMNGDDSNDPEQMRLAADDWELLASNYRNQPATDWEEDRARWRAHELRRRIDLIEGTRPFTGHLQPSESLVRHAWAQAWGTVELVFWHVMARWLIQRTLVGYLLQLHRLGVTALLVLLGFALVYKFAIGPDDIGHGNFPPIPIESPEGIVTDYDYSDAHAYWQKDWRNPFYLSITTFVTLGYGDFQPAAGWLKLATALEGLIGVTLLALFTVAWGRKMVR